MNTRHTVKTNNKNGGGKIVFKIRQGLITEKLKVFEEDISETVCLGVTILKNLWFITCVYRPPYNNNKTSFSVNFQIPCVLKRGNFRTFSLLVTKT